MVLGFRGSGLRGIRLGFMGFGHPHGLPIQGSGGLGLMGLTEFRLSLFWVEGILSFLGLGGFSGLCGRALRALPRFYQRLQGFRIIVTKKF